MYADRSTRAEVGQSVLLEISTLRHYHVAWMKTELKSQIHYAFRLCRYELQDWLV